MNAKSKAHDAPAIQQPRDDVAAPAMKIEIEATALKPDGD